MCGCKNKISGMAKRKKYGKGVTIGMEDVVAVGAGAVAGLLVNIGASMALDKFAPDMDEETRENVDKGVQVAKVVGGGYAATQKTLPRYGRFAGLGLAGEGAVELATSLDERLSIAGTSGSLFNEIGASGNIVKIPLGQGRANDYSADDVASTGADDDFDDAY